MGSVHDLKLPLIDFSGAAEPGTAAWADVRAKVMKAVEEFGSFEARFDRVPLELRNGVLGTLEELFNLPLQTKERFVSTKQPYGYIGPSLSMPLLESMGIDDGDNVEKLDSLAHTFWPQGNPHFTKILHSYTEKISGLDKIVRRMIFESLGVEKYIEEHLDSTNYLFFLMKYAGGSGEKTTTGAKNGMDGHTDKTVITILHQNHVAGLQVQTKGGDWIDYEPSPESFVVIVGDSLYAWANGRVHSAKHRVMMTGNEIRYSFGLFSVPKRGCIIKAPEELVDSEHPVLFKPFDYNQFMEFCDSEQGKKVENAHALKAYCGA